MLLTVRSHQLYLHDFLLLAIIRCPSPIQYAGALAGFTEAIKNVKHADNAHEICSFPTLLGPAWLAFQHYWDQPASDHPA
jgi:hypothetical protein